MKRRHFLQTTALFPAAAASPQNVRNAVEFGNRFVLWQSAYGGADPVKCPYRTPGETATQIQGLGPPTRALYKLYQATGAGLYKEAADRYATFLMNTVRDPETPYTNRFTVGGRSRHALSSAWMYGKALSPCFEWFSLTNPDEDAFQQKGYALYRWLQGHRREDSYFGVGYPTGKYPDAQFSCDLGEVGTGLMGFYRITNHKPALDDATGLAKYFLTDYQDGSGRGIWSPKLSVWLVGPWPEGGAEHFTDQRFNQTGWGWSALVVGEFLLRLREQSQDSALRAGIEDKCLKAFRWCFDKCQFEDGAHGMFGRDDKWVGQGAAAILLYLSLKRQNLVPPDVELEYRPKVDKSWRWMLENTGRDSYPADGYIRVTGRTSKKPPENLMWMMAWTMEALLEGGKVFSG
jgi:hypothetical protein